MNHDLLVGFDTFDTLIDDLVYSVKAATMFLVGVATLLAMPRHLSFITTVTIENFHCRATKYGIVMRKIEVAKKTNVQGTSDNMNSF